MADKPIIIALDFDNTEAVWSLLDQLDPRACRVKIGKELFTRCGPGLVREVVARDFDVFLDLKFHDIPNTVARAVAAAAELGVWMVNVHACGGRAMLEAARDVLQGMDDRRPLLTGVTVLTSLDHHDLREIGIDREPLEQVSKLALLAESAGLDGVVCSAAETPLLRQQLKPETCLVTPGIRRPEDAGDDQKRVVSPAEALRNGSDYLVVGRPITRAGAPAEALAAFNSALTGV